MRILVTGARGLLGSEFVRAARARGISCVPLGREDADVTDADAVGRVIGATVGGSEATAGSAAWVVHCAAYTAVDSAEAEPELAMRVNREGAANVARAAATAGAGMVYISTDYVYDGPRAEPWMPTDPVAPRSMYARSKLEGERAVQEVYRAGGPLTGWLYGAGGHNFARAILDRAERGESLRVVDDQRGRPTWARNVAETVLDLLTHDVMGVWHVADGGDATWLEFAREALRLCGRGCRAKRGGPRRRVRGIRCWTWRPPNASWVDR